MFVDGQIFDELVDLELLGGLLGGDAFGEKVEFLEQGVAESGQKDAIIGRETDFVDVFVMGGKVGRAGAREGIVPLGFVVQFGHAVDHGHKELGSFLLAGVHGDEQSFVFVDVGSEGDGVAFVGGDIIEFKLPQGATDGVVTFAFFASDFGRKDDVFVAFELERDHDVGESVDAAESGQDEGALLKFFEVVGLVIPGRRPFGVGGVSKVSDVVDGDEVAVARSVGGFCGDFGPLALFLGRLEGPGRRGDEGQRHTDEPAAVVLDGAVHDGRDGQAGGHYSPRWWGATEATDVGDDEGGPEGG